LSDRELWLESRGEELAVKRLKVILQQLFASFNGSTHDSDDASDFAIGTEIADTFGFVLGKFSHIGIAGSHRFRDGEAASLHIGKGLGSKILGGKRSGRDGHCDGNLFLGVLENGCVQPEGRFSVKWSVFTSAASAVDAQRRIPKRQVVVSARNFLYYPP